MLGQGGVGMGVQLAEELLFVGGRHRAVTACRLDPHMQGVGAVPFQITVDRDDMNGEVLCGFLRRGSTQNEIDDSTPKFQPVPIDPCRIHRAIMPNSLKSVTGGTD